MADKFKNLGDFNIPDDLLDKHEWVSDFFIDSLGKDCTLVYPPKIEPCPNCYIDPRTRRSNNRYKAGGPKSFPNGTICPWCGGAGQSKKEETEDLKLRVYWTPKDWVNLNIELDAPESSAQVIGYMKDLPKFEKAQYILLNKDIQGYTRLTCQRTGEAIPWGFRQNRYFIQFVQRIGGG